MPTTLTSPITLPTTAPPPVTSPTEAPWPQRFTVPIHICPQQRRELTSPDVAP
jgi:hypothetical protein